MANLVLIFKHCSIPTLVSNGSAITDNLIDKASLLNSFFYKCFNANSPPLPNLPLNLQPSNYPVELLCDEAEVYDLILGLDPTKSTGPDGISVKMLPGTIDAIVPSLTRIFSLSLSTGTYPNSSKLARIVPVSKSRDSADPTNYRPISILSVVSKLLERHVHQLIFRYLSIHHPLSVRQWGFWPERCTASAQASFYHP